LSSVPARKLAPDDYPLVEAALNDLVRHLQAHGSKQLYQHLDVAATMESLPNMRHAYIVAGSYLVVYDLIIPWFSRTVLLQELLVLRLNRASTFDVVPDFLSAQAAEAGASLILVGTMLAKSDRALASLYSRSGFVEAARVLSKEP